MTYWDAFILAVIEGITEYLPISSTGHLIVASSYMGIDHDPFVQSFNIIIQFGAILSVLVLYWRRFLNAKLEFYKKIFIAFLPAAIIGLLVKKKIDALLESVTVVAWALIIGGIALVLVDWYFEKRAQSQQISKKEIGDLTHADCAKLGFFQCMAFIPGTSRSAASIVGGMLLSLKKKEAAEFSFFLAVPTLAGATFIKSLDVIKDVQANQIGLLLFGSAVAFVVAMFAIKAFIELVTRIGFTAFGLYRIVLGIVILLTLKN